MQDINLTIFSQFENNPAATENVDYMAIFVGVEKLLVRANHI
jgi:hypothetical protein